ncbi:MAG TPA: 30S ribosomal protein S6, partial [Desulfobacterales bacterium]|nr:30S ribosomal protein S6 [Desulfobacterales bacterium]
MRRYETIFIADNDLSEEDRSPIFEKLKDLIQQHSGLLVMVDEWGGKKLAYEIKKKARGYYVRLDYCGSGILVNEIERFFRIDDRILKYMTVLLDKDVDIEAVKEEIVTAEKAQADETESSKAEPEAKPDVEPDAEPEAKPDVEPDAEPDAEPEAKPDVE